MSASNHYWHPRGRRLSVAVQRQGSLQLLPVRCSSRLLRVLQGAVYWHLCRRWDLRSSHSCHRGCFGACQCLSSFFTTLKATVMCSCSGSVSPLLGCRSFAFLDFGGKLNSRCSYRRQGATMWLITTSGGIWVRSCRRPSSATRIGCFCSRCHHRTWDCSNFTDDGGIRIRKQFCFAVWLKGWASIPICSGQAQGKALAIRCW
mmetsp:Transcript_66426/g.158963  ORF Transcript_66426/g.158963 Transcript_66426/m.158963 type:complete len:203 (-) Transcript_66426:570-1178(-)